MSRFPLEPMAAKAIVASADEGCSEDVIAVLSMLTTDSVFRFQGSNMSGERGRKNLGREQYARKEGDHITLLEVFRAFRVCGVKRRRNLPHKRYQPSRHAQGSRHLQAAHPGCDARRN